MFENQYIQQRISKAEELRSTGINPYENRAERDCTTREFLERFESVKDLEERKNPDVTVSVVGRIKFLRLMGKAAFAKIEDEAGVLQIYYSKNDLDEDFQIAKKMYEVGDILNVSGYPFVTKTGELTLYVTAMKLLTKAIVPLPEKFHGLQDKELRYRQRYLDMVMNPDVKQTFQTRSLVVSTIRRFFENEGFLEVETPMMHPIAGGATARPFITHHNALGVDRYLRIAPELYLKRLLVGGMEAVFEINRNFRNEGMDATHNPEFTMIEFYWAYHQYEDLMDLTEKLFEKLFETLNLPKELPFDEHVVNYATPFQRIDYKEALATIGGLEKDTIHDAAKLKQKLLDAGVKIDREMSLGMLQAEAFDAFVEYRLINPTFVTGFPLEISPLARKNDENPEIVDRFELFIAGREIANGFNELNDPLDQHERFLAQVQAKEGGDVEANDMDEDYVWALAHGMPPAAGQGIGIDRLVMLLTNSHSIRDVLLFPAMRPQVVQADQDTPKEES